MQVLPDGAADGARDADVVLEARESPLYGLRNQFGHHRAAFDPQLSFVEELEVARRVPDDEAAKALVADEYVGAEPEYEIVDAEISGGGDRPCQVVGRCCIVEQIARTT